jgi:hypothetical protein
MAYWNYDEWIPEERALFDDLMRDHPGGYTDDDAQWYFHQALFEFHEDREERQTLYQEMLDYFDDEYLMDFEQDFDWEAFREWYDSTAA